MTLPSVRTKRLPARALVLGIYVRGDVLRTMRVSHYAQLPVLERVRTAVVVLCTRRHGTLVPYLGKHVV